jgi:hypothetical protein
MGAAVTRMERSGKASHVDTEFDDGYRDRSLSETTPSRNQQHRGHTTLRKRKDDPEPSYPKLVKGKELSQHPEDVIAAALKAAEVSVGRARLNEALATAIVLNVMRLIELEVIFGQEVDFAARTAFRQPRIVKEQPPKAA